MAPRVQFLFATTADLLFERNAKALERAGDYLVVNQIEDPLAAPRDPDPRVLAFSERGLARSRNRALQNATAELCYLCDDDVELADRASQRVAQAFDEHPAADILIFRRLESLDAVDHDVASTRFPLPAFLRLLGVCSIQIAFRRQAVIASGVGFDERFGLGAEFPTSEEAIFLADCRRAGLSIEWTSSGVVAHPLETSGSDYADPALAVAKGAMLYRLFGPARWIFGLLLALTSYPLYRAHLSPLSFLAALQRGARRFRGSAA